MIHLECSGGVLGRSAIICHTSIAGCLDRECVSDLLEGSHYGCISRDVADGLLVVLDGRNDICSVYRQRSQFVTSIR